MGCVTDGLNLFTELTFRVFSVLSLDVKRCQICRTLLRAERKFPKGKFVEGKFKLIRPS